MVKFDSLRFIVILYQTVLNSLKQSSKMCWKFGCEPDMNRRQECEENEFGKPWVEQVKHLQLWIQYLPLINVYIANWKITIFNRYIMIYQL